MKTRKIVAIRRSATYLVASLICAGTFAVIAEAHAGHAAHNSTAVSHAVPVLAVNPQPLPPLRGDALRTGPVLAINPQPLPPRVEDRLHIGPTLAINPQPLPPRVEDA